MGATGRADYGQVTIKVGDSEYTLKPSLAALKAITRRWKDDGGLLGAINSMAMPDVEDIVFVIAVGVGMDRKKIAVVEQEIFDSGYITHAAAMAEFMTLLANPTGREIDPDEEEVESGEA